MRGWRSAPLGDLAEVQLGKMLDQKKNQGEYLPYLGNDNVQWNEFKLDDVKQMRIKDDERERLRLRPGDLLVCEGGNPGRCALWTSDREMYYQKALNRVRVGEELDPCYLLYYMVHLGMTQEIRQYYTGGATIKHLPNAALKGVEVRYPDLDEQRRIAGILGAYDRLIENDRRQIALLDEAAQRLYKEWFVDLRFPESEAVPVVNGLPEGWVRGTLADVCAAYGGGTPSTRVSSYWENGTIPWATPSDVTSNLGYYLPHTEKQITPDGLAHSSAHLLPAGTILMTSRASIGHFAICDYEVCTNQGFIACIPQVENATWWLMCELQSRVDEMRGLSKGSTFLELSKTTFRTMPTIIPSHDLLAKFDAIAGDMYELAVSARKQCDAAREARDRLLPKLMSGEMEA